jgi:hypothetical protein
MTPYDCFGTRFMSGEGLTPPVPDNENLRLMPDWMTPAELMQWVRQEKERLSREIAKDSRLWSCPEHRRTWHVRLAMEQLARRLFYGRRQG